MIILSIETSCDETAISLLDCKGGVKNPSFKVLGNALHSQTEIHEQYGGVFPMMAKRSHTENIVPIFLHATASLKLKVESLKLNSQTKYRIQKILEKERGLFDIFEKYLLNTKKPPIDLIAVTEGPGLEPALWVGINFAKALGVLWNIPVMGVNHMEGHFFSVLVGGKKVVKSGEWRVASKIQYPTLALLVSGGHTELVLSKKPLSYKILGATRDDAIGEAFDKVARILGLPYPGGPAISALAERLRSLEAKKLKSLKSSPLLSSEAPKLSSFSLPRPMIHSKDFDFSFSGIKTAVLYMVQKLQALSPKLQAQIAMEFENAVVEVLVSKTEKALLQNNVSTLIVAGGVSANKHLQKEIKKLQKKYPELSILFPEKNLTGDNAVMIGVAAYIRNLKFKIFNLKKTENEKRRVTRKIEAQGNLKISD